MVRRAFVTVSITSLYRMLRLNQLRKDASGGYVLVDNNEPVAPFREASAPAGGLKTGATKPGLAMAFDGFSGS